MIKLKINRPIGCGTLISTRRMIAQGDYHQMLNSFWNSSVSSYMTVSNSTMGWSYLAQPLTTIMTANNWRESWNFYPREDL